MNVAAIILAAGSSSRMGRSKQLLPVGGRSMLQRAIAECVAANLNTTVVLGANADAHLSEIGNAEVKVVVNENWENGMGTSIKAGIAEIMKQFTPDAVIFVVCDQPKLMHEHLTALIETKKKTGKKIVASRYANTAGVPVLFDQTVFPELLQLDDNEGARKLINTHPDSVATVPFPGGEIDLDTPQDYNRYINNNS